MRVVHVVFAATSALEKFADAPPPALADASVRGSGHSATTADDEQTVGIAAPPSTLPGHVVASVNPWLYSTASARFSEASRSRCSRERCCCVSLSANDASPIVS